MTGTLVHRGPDDEGFYLNDGISLGVRRLSIVDVEKGRQPIHNEDGRIWTVFNGEIYNSRYLRRELEDRGHRFYTDHSDTEVIVHLYEEYGKAFPHKINGMFSSFWDKESEELFLWRDRMGVKPLFYQYINGMLIFGSEIKTVLAYTRMQSTD